MKIIGPDQDRPLFDWLIGISEGKEYCEFHGLRDGQRASKNSINIEGFDVQHETSENALGFIISEKPQKNWIPSF